MFTLMFYIPLYTEYVNLETFFQDNLLAWYWKKLNPAQPKQATQEQTDLR